MFLTKGIKNIVLTIASRPFSARRYWEARHKSFRGSLRSVGHAGLAEQANAEQYATKRARIAAMIRRHIADPRGKSLLDAGCGIGALTTAYVDLGFDVTGADFSLQAITEAQSRGIEARFVHASLENLSIGRRFDVITAIDVLQHIVDNGAWSKSFASLANHLASDGLLLILDGMEDGNGPSAIHCHRRPLNKYAAALEDIGLRIIEQELLYLEHEGSMKHLLVAHRDG